MACGKSLKHAGFGRNIALWRRIHERLLQWSGHQENNKGSDVNGASDAIRVKCACSSPRHREAAMPRHDLQAGVSHTELPACTVHPTLNISWQLFASAQRAGIAYRARA